MLRYKAEEAGVVYAEAPTTTLKPTQRCHACWRVEKKRLDERWHSCPCGVECSRDLNAALVLLYWGMAHYTSVFLAGVWRYNTRSRELIARRMVKSPPRACGLGGEVQIRTARAKGLSGGAVVLRHALKNALLPVITLSSIQLGNLLGGTVIMETIFTLPGVGRYLVDAIFHRDYPVTQAIVVMMGTLFVCLNLVVDLLYAWLDPRIRYD